MAYKDPGHGRACDRERYRRRTAERLCPRHVSKMRRGPARGGSQLVPELR